MKACRVRSGTAGARRRDRSRHRVRLVPTCEDRAVYRASSRRRRTSNGGGSEHDRPSSLDLPRGSRSQTDNTTSAFNPFWATRRESRCRSRDADELAPGRLIIVTALYRESRDQTLQIQLRRDNHDRGWTPGSRGSLAEKPLGRYPYPVNDA